MRFDEYRLNVRRRVEYGFVVTVTREEQLRVTMAANNGGGRYQEVEGIKYHTIQLRHSLIGWETEFFLPPIEIAFINKFLET